MRRAAAAAGGGGGRAAAAAAPSRLLPAPAASTLPFAGPPRGPAYQPGGAVTSAGWPRLSSAGEALPAHGKPLPYAVPGAAPREEAVAAGRRERSARRLRAEMPKARQETGTRCGVLPHPCCPAGGGGAVCLLPLAEWRRPGAEALTASSEKAAASSVPCQARSVPNMPFYCEMPPHPVCVHEPPPYV